MKNNVMTLAAGILIGISLMLFIGAKWDAKTSKATAAACSVSCSADGKFVYAAGLNSVYKSDDFGKTWAVVFSDQ